MESLKDILVPIIATIGMVLGVINTYRDWQRDKVKLRVTTGMAGHSHMKWDVMHLSVSVTNLSSVAVTWQGAEIVLNRVGENRLTFPEVAVQFPIRLEPRSSESVIFPHFIEESPDCLPHLAIATHVIVRTACGHTAKTKCDFGIYTGKYSRKKGGDA